VGRSYNGTPATRKSMEYGSACVLCTHRWPLPSLHEGLEWRFFEGGAGVERGMTGNYRR